MPNHFGRGLQVALVVFGVYAFTEPVRAQDPPLSSAEIGQIVDEVLTALIPPHQAVSRVPVAKRKVFFDHARTIAAFGLPGSASANLSNLGLRSSVRPGTKSLIDDCDVYGRKPCNQLGWGIYAWIEPLSMSATAARVRAHIVWPDRGRNAFEKGVTPSGRATLVGFSTEVYLTRSQDGTWKFEKEGRTLVGE